MNKNELNKSFKIPENYFENLNDKIYLNNLKKQEDFKVPENYFNQLEKNILEQTIDNSETKVFHFNLWWAAACVLVLTLVAIPFVMYNKEDKSTEIVDSKVEDQVYEKIYDTYIVTDQNKKSPNVTLDDSDFALYDY